MRIEVPDRAEAIRDSCKQLGLALCLKSTTF